MARSYCGYIVARRNTIMRTQILRTAKPRMVKWVILKPQKWKTGYIVGYSADTRVVETFLNMKGNSGYDLVSIARGVSQKRRSFLGSRGRLYLTRITQPFCDEIALGGRGSLVSLETIEEVWFGKIR